MPWALLAAGCLAMFAASASGTTRAPFLIAMAEDLSTTLPVVANLMALTAIAWGVTSGFAGAAADRHGRRPFLIGGPIGLGIGLYGVSLSDSVLALAVWATVVGGCAGAYTGVLMTEVADRTVDRQRGRALGWIMAGQSLSLLVGVPLAAWIGSAIGWRGVNQVSAGVAVLTALALFLTTLRPSDGGSATRRSAPGMHSIMTRPVLQLLAMSIGERVGFGLSVVYFATFLQTAYGLTPAGVALPLGIVAIGNIVGTLLGGQVADRLPDRRRTFALSIFGSGVTALALYGWTPGIAATVALGCACSTFSAMSRPSLMAALATVPEEVRGTVLGLNTTAACVGWIGAASLGGWIMASFGFGAFGPFIMAVSLIAAVLAMMGRR